MSGLLSELQRRNVIRTGIAYAAVGWLVIEVASVVFPTFSAPTWVLQVFVTLIALGLPVALLLSWMFEVTAQGVVRTADGATSKTTSATPHRRLDTVIIIALLAVVGILVADRLYQVKSPGQTKAGAGEGTTAAAPAGHDPPAAATGVPKSVAVLPFVNLSGDPEQEYFSDGLTEELLNRLAKIPALKVPARSSCFHFKGKTDLQEVKRALGVDAVLEGSVRKSGSALRISAQLTDVNTGYSLWTKAYERQLTDIFAVQDDITNQIITALELRLDPSSEQSAASRPVDSELYQLMLRGRYHWNQRSQEGFARALEIFTQAVKDYPEHAPAYAGLADVYLSQFDYGLIPWGESTEKARIAATTALELDNTLAAAHTSLAHLNLHEWRWQLAEREFIRALELEPNYVVARHWYALYLTAMGRVEEAVQTMQRAHELDPLSIRISADLGMAYLAAGHYDEAVAQETRTLELSPDAATPKWIRGMALEQLGRFDQAERDMRVVLEAWERDPSILGSLGHLLAVAGREAEARELLEELVAQAEATDVTFFAALIHVGLGEKDAAFDWLDRAVTTRSGSARYLLVEARLDPLRDDPRFDALIERVGLSREQL